MRLQKLAIAAGVIVFLAAFGLSVNVAVPVRAQSEVSTTATPTPRPKNQVGQAKCAVSSQSFKSLYPNGFEFKLRATSSKIKYARVNWRSTPKVGHQVWGVIEPNGEITATEKSGDFPQWVRVIYYWILTDEAGNECQTPTVHEEYADLTRKWNRFESEDIYVFVEDGVPDPDTVGQEILKAMAERRPFFQRNWEKPLSSKPVAIIYSKFETWAEWSPGAGTADPDGLKAVGQTSNSWGGTVQVYIPRQGPEGLAKGTVSHEVQHMYQFANGGTTHCWFYEGDATHAQTFQDYDYLARVQDMAASGELLSLQAGGPTCSERLGYDIGYAFWAYIEISYGPDAHREIWKLVGKGKTDEQAVEIYTGLTFVEVETDFRAWLGMENPVAPTPIPTPEFIFPPTPTYEPTSTPKPKGS